MSWIDKIKTDYIITCGDGVQFKPLWLTASKEVEYNIAEFEFPNVSGTLVKRTLPKGRRYAIQIYFQGEDNLDQADAFEKSADDSRAWVIQHPFYGSITVQPTGLKRDNTEYNVSQFRMTVIETITEENPKVVVNLVGTINATKLALDEALIAAMQETPTQEDVILLDQTNNGLFEKGKKLTKALEAYFNAFKKANAAIRVATSKPLAAMRAIQSVINAPALFVASVKSRKELIVDQFNSLLTSIPNSVASLNSSSKRIFELNASALISSLAIVAISPQPGDYNTRKDVLDLIDTLIDPDTGVYNVLLKKLDELQTANGGTPNSYMPNAESMALLNNLLNYTISNLFALALNGKQERSYVCEDDTNAILLTHRFYGLDSNDENLARFIQNNNIGLSEILEIRKGRTVIYYV